ncbi:MAG: asparagine synthase (glutamine-hydrolyzing) [Rhodomicrobium sp.]
MCGIVGVAAKRPVRSRGWLAAGRDAMAHRGPDDAGEYWSDDGRVGFGHRRLSIIDLSAAGHQPMQTPDGQLCITFNGEIYNYTELKRELESCGHAFRSSSDTEVILAAYRQWGKDCLSRLHGMFAFAVYDKRAATVFLARDRAGEKPIFYRHAGGELRFASELKALLADPELPRRVNRVALDCYLAAGYIFGEHCILEGMQKLPAAHALLFNAETGALRIWRYWNLPDFDPGTPSQSEDELVDRLESLLTESVRRQLIADVPVGLLLSGGVDSSLITALAVRAGCRPKTFTVGFGEFPQFDETRHAGLIADHFGTEHTVLEAGEVKPELLPKLARQYDEPMIDPSMIPTHLVSEQISQRCKVALGGDGGDELFGGYYAASRVAALQQKYSGIPSIARGAAASLAVSWPVGSKGRDFLAQLGADPASDVPPFTPYFDKADRNRLLPQHADWPLAAKEIRQARVPSTPDPVQRVTRFDFANYMVEDILVKVDRASMLNSLEVRSPFLDVSVIEFAFGSVPSHLKATPRDRKIILKKLAARLLPGTFDMKRKQGFGAPLESWLRTGPWRRLFEDVLFDPGAAFSKPEIEKLFRGLETGRCVKNQLFGLALFELWRKQYGVAL